MLTRCSCYVQIIFEGGCALLKDLNLREKLRSGPDYDIAVQLYKDSKEEEAVEYLLQTVVKQKLGYQRVLKCVLEQDR